MKIAQVVCSFPPYRGGIGKSASILGQFLSDEHQLHTFTLVPLDKNLTQLEENTSYLKPWLRFGHGAFSLSLLFKLRGYDCIYLHYPFFGTAEIVWLYKMLNPKTKLIIHYHMDVSFSSPIAKILSWPAELIKKSLFKQSQAIIVSSFDYAKNSQIAKILKKYPDRFHELPFSVDTKKFKPKMEESRHDSPLIAKTKSIIDFVTKTFIKRHKVNFLFVGGLDSAHYFKGIDIMLQAAKSLEKNNWKISIVGDGNLKEEYISLSEKLGISDKVEFLGKVDDDELIRCYQQSDCFVLPSVNSNEAFGIVLIEAMACGLPVIASSLPGVRSVFRDKQEGLYCQPGDIDSLKEAMAKMLSDQEARKRMGRAARSWADEKYSLESVKARIKDIFKRI